MHQDLRDKDLLNAFSDVTIKALEFKASKNRNLNEHLEQVE